MEMSPEKWERVKALFEAALELEPAAAAAFLTRACPDDEIRKEGFFNHRDTEAHGMKKNGLLCVSVPLWRDL